MEAGDRKEWVWSDYTKANLICIRKMGLTDYEASQWSSSDSGDEYEKSSDENSDDNELGQSSDSDSEESSPIVRMHKRDESYEE